MATVRRAAPEDARTIADIQIETWRATYVGVMPQDVLDSLDVDDRARNWAHWLTVDATAQFLVERDGAEVGFVSAGPCRHEDVSGEVYAIYVRPEAWGTGSGWALMDAAVRLARRALARRRSSGSPRRTRGRAASTSAMGGSRSRPAWRRSCPGAHVP